MTSPNRGASHSRRALLFACAATVATTGRPAHALSPVVALILPTLIAGGLSLLGIRRQVEADARRQEAELRMAHDQLAFQRESMLRQERIAVVQALMSHQEALGSLPVDQRLNLLQGIAIDLHAQRPATRVLSENIDGMGTRLGLVRGCLAVERAGQGSLVDNQVALDLGADALDAGNALAVAVSGVQRDLNSRLADELAQAASEQWGRPRAEVDSRFALAGVRHYSRARQPRGNPDVRAAMFIPREGRQVVRYAYG